MYNIQANTARFIYTLSLSKPQTVKFEQNNDKTLTTSAVDSIEKYDKGHSGFAQEGYVNNHSGHNNTGNNRTNDSCGTQDTEDGNVCRLKKNGFYITKEARSDEKLRYTETDMHAIVRTTIFFHVFNVIIVDSLTDIIKTGVVNVYLQEPYVRTIELNLKTIIRLLDLLFGCNFSKIAKLPLASVYDEYHKRWKYFTYETASTSLPSASDIVKLARFVNASSAHYAPATLFMMCNARDHKIPLQSNLKKLF